MAAVAQSGVRQRPCEKTSLGARGRAGASGGRLFDTQAWRRIAAREWPAADARAI